MKRQENNLTILENKGRSAEEESSLAVAEASREQEWKSKSFIASIYFGDLDMSLAHPFPLQSEEDKKIGDDICGRVEEWAKENVDGAAIDEQGDIPKHVFEGMQKLGLFALKVPKEYGGHGLSQTNYQRVLATVGRYCISTSVTLSAHQSIGVPQPLKLFGTEAQKKKYLGRIAQGEISAFALTEHGVGSDPANVETHAELTDDGNHWLLNGEKLWCTNGVIADQYVVMARTPDQQIGSRNVKQVTAFIVEAEWDGVEVLHRCEFMGLKGIYNGLIRFNNVKVPKENVVGEVGRGLKLALATLNDGRLSIPALSAAASRDVTEFCNKWAKSRVQWGRQIGRHEPGAQKVAYMNASTYAMETLSGYTAQLSDSGDVDIRMEASTAKLWVTEEFWKVLDLGMQLRGGRGYETDRSLERRGESSFPIERWMRDTRVNRILEGSTEIMHLFLAREALDPHFKNAGPLLSKSSAGDKLKALGYCAAFYPVWYLKLWLGSLFSWFKPFAGFEGSFKPHLRWINRRTKKLARALFHQMIRQGPKLEYKQLILARVIDIGIELATMSLVAARAQKEASQGDRSNVQTALYWLESRRLVVDQLFREISHNDDKAATSLAKSILESAEELPQPEKGKHPELKPLERKFGKQLTGSA
jgi:hypothetical protein